jgi:alkylated DNA repair dioxygenase AlkB
MTEELELSKGGKIQYIPNLIEDPDALFDELINLPWKTGIFKIFGKEIPTPRKIFGIGKQRYEVPAQSDTWPPLLKSLKKELEKAFGIKFSYAHLNLYEDGNDYIGFHSDNETVNGTSVFSVSLGASRTFHLKEKKSGKTTHKLVLEGNSLLILDYLAVKVNYKHAVLKEAAVKKPRINVTFRT